MVEKIIYYHNNEKITKLDIKKMLLDSGVKSGDLLMVHSDLSTFGRLGDVKSRDEFMSIILDAFIETLGPEGTLIVPTYTWSFGKKEIFDVNNSKSTTGAFTEFIRKDKRAVRSDDPMISHVAIGKMSSLMLKLSNNSHGEGSLFDYLVKNDAKIMNFGMDFNITFLHHIEYIFNVNYRFIKRFRGVIIDRNRQEKKAEVLNYVRFLPEHGCDVDKDMNPLKIELQKKHQLNEVTLGAGIILCCKARDCLSVGLEMLSKNEYCFLTHDPRIIVNKM